MKITKPLLKEFRKEMNEALGPVFEKYGMEVEIGKIRFGEDDFVANVNVSSKGPDGESVAQTKFENHCEEYGLKKSDFGRKFTYDGKVFEIVGIRTNATRNPIVAANSNGKKYNFSVALVIEGLSDLHGTSVVAPEAVEEAKRKKALQEQKAFEANCYKVGLRSSDFGKKFAYRGEKYVIVGVNPRAHKYPLICRCGKKDYKFDIETVGQNVEIGF